MVAEVVTVVGVDVVISSGGIDSANVSRQISHPRMNIQLRI